MIRVHVEAGKNISNVTVQVWQKQEPENNFAAAEVCQLPTALCLTSFYLPPQ